MGEPDQAPVEAQRCAATKFDVRCQLLADHDPTSPHVAMSRRTGRPAGYVTWTEHGLGESSWSVEASPQRWAPTFPRIESR